ncbi:hypothetical protein ABUL39_04195 [Rhodothermus marinus]|uniref:hypothetical protein n=1 Tax=Rhodothermus marinus TaxID=29549 RepID=UPI0037CB9712
MLTFDRDYGALVYRMRSPVPSGIVLFRFDPQTPEEPAQWLLRVLQQPGLFLYDFRDIMAQRVSMTTPPPQALRASSPCKGERCLRATAGGGAGRLRVLQRRGFLSCASPSLPGRGPGGGWLLLVPDAAHSGLEARCGAPALSHMHHDFPETVLEGKFTVIERERARQRPL